MSDCVCPKENSFFRKAAGAAKWVASLTKIGIANTIRATFPIQVSSLIRSFIAAIIQNSLCKPDDGECDGDILDGRVDKVCLATRVEDRDWCNHGNGNAAINSGISLPKRRECTNFAPQKDWFNLFKICIKIFGCEIFDNLYCKMKRSGKGGTLTSARRRARSSRRRAPCLPRAASRHLKTC